MWDVICKECGGVFIRHIGDSLPDSHSEVQAAYLRHVDGSAVQPGDIAQCDSCNAPWWPAWPGVDGFREVVPA